MFEKGKERKRRRESSGRKERRKSLGMRRGVRKRWRD
jgi:hypothetical protein